MKGKKAAKGRGRAARKLVKAGLPKSLEQVNLNAAGIDVGGASHFVAVPADRGPTPVRSFPSFTADLHRLADWLQACGIDTVAMESTGIYWLPLYEILEERGIEVLLVNAHHVKTVPGRKTDVLDCQWLQQLHTFGLLRGSFRPAQEARTLRAYMRQRDTLVRYAAQHVQHAEKALVLMNLQLRNVITDVVGATGMAILRDIVAGKTDPHELAKHRDYRCHASEEEIARSLTGNYRPEHVFALKQALDLYDRYQQSIAECDEHVEHLLRELAALTPAPARPAPAPRTKKNPRRNEPAFDIRGPLYDLTGVDITQIPAIGPYTALRVISEIGTDMSRWPSAKHFASWATLSPGSKISGGKVLDARTKPFKNRLAMILRIAATSLRNTQTALGAFYRRIAFRRGAAKAVTAVARKLAVYIYTSLRQRSPHSDPGADYYEIRYRARALHGLQRKAADFGYLLVPAPQNPEQPVAG